jgi:phospholipase C
MRQRKWPAAIALGAMLSAQTAAPLVYAGQGNHNNSSTTTPIKHLIVLIAENWSFDSVYATYQHNGDEQGDEHGNGHSGEVANLLSKGIVNADGSPGPSQTLAMQDFVNTPLPATYFISSSNKAAYSPLPPPEASNAPNVQMPLGPSAPFDASVTDAELAMLEPSLEVSDLGLLRTGATGLANTTFAVDTRITNATNLPNTSFQITGPILPYDAYTGDTVHRFYHMWQQSDCNVANATPSNPSGCLKDLLPFVGLARDNSGGNAMGFFNVQNGDAPVFKRLADEFTLSDNFHQSVMGGTAANHVALGTGDAIFWTTFGGMTQPPASQIADPDPISPTSDKYKNDKAWTNCGDVTQPGVKPIRDYLATLSISPNCQNVFYMVNNLSPGTKPNGMVDTASITAGTKVPPSALRTIGDELNDNHISWKYYGGGYNAAVRVANGSVDPTDKAIAQNYCDICNFESYTSSIMGDTTQRTTHIKDATDFFADLQAGTLPAVSFVKPDSYVDGHPASSKLGLFEAMLENIVDQMGDRSDTALFVAFDESGGFWDSGYMQPLDFFGDGPRIPFLVVSKYSKHGQVVHTYYDHVSILKFIEANWSLPPLTGRSRDNLKNPVTAAGNPYVPTNSPAIGDLMDMFDFHGNHEE